MLTIVDEYSRFPFAFACANTDAKTVINCLNCLFSLFGMPNCIHTDRAATFMSHELSSYLQRRGIACSHTSVYNAPGNGQCERYNGIIWSAVKLALKSRNLDIRQWESVLPDALHSIRSLLCTATNSTPHERMFNFERRSTFGTSVPMWMSEPGPVFLKRHKRTNKYDSVVDKVDLIHATPNYAVVRMFSGRETTVSLRDIAPYYSCEVLPNPSQSGEGTDFDRRNDSVVNDDSVVVDGSVIANDSMVVDGGDLVIQNRSSETIIGENENNVGSQTTTQPDAPRRSSRVRKAVDRYGAVPYS